MANPDLLNPFVRKSIVEEIKSQENIKRKRESLKAYEIYNDNAHPYVYEALRCQLSESTVKQMQIVSNLNIAKAVVNKEANIYTDCPNRDYEDVTENDEYAIKSAYEDGGFDSVLAKANKYFKLNNQSFIQAYPQDGMIKLRVLHGHNIDVIPDSENPEKAYAYIISSFDKAYWLKTNSDGVNQKIAESDDYKAMSERYQIWTKEVVITIDGRGNLIEEPLENKLGMLNIIDVSKDKDFEFFVRIGKALTDFTIDFNVTWSDQLFTQRMQGYSIGVLSGDANLKPDSFTIGANKMIFLPTNPSNPDSNLKFEFVSPNPNSEASLKTLDALIATFLTTRGLDTKAISSNNSGNASYSSALERLLAMIDQFRASKEDFDLFNTVELKLHKIVSKYLSILNNTEHLDQKYWASSALENSDLNLQFVKPEMVETKAEQLANEQLKIEMGISDKVLALMSITDMSEDAAVEQIDEIQQRKLEAMKKLTQPEVVEPISGNTEA